MGNRILQLFFLLVFLSGCSTTDQSTSDSLQSEANKPKQQQGNLYPEARVCDTLKYLFAQNNKQLQLKSFYKNNGYNPVWTNDSAVIQGIQLIKFSKYHGLNPNEYNFHEIDSLYNCIHFENDNSTKTYLQLELVLSKGIIKYCSHLLKGKLKPLDFHTGWNYPQRTIQNSDSLILNKIKENKVSELEALLEPNNGFYTVLKTELRNLYILKLQENSNGSIKYPGFIIKEGDSNKYVSQLKKRLAIADSVNWKFTAELKDSIKSFQHKHGLASDGLPGIKTYEFLGWDTQRHIDALKVNMERMRWLNDSILQKGLVVNIPSCELFLFNDGSLAFSSKIIVGKAKSETPVFKSAINYLVFNPCWTVPNSIATDKMLPKLIKDSLYLQNHNMFLGLNGIEQNVDSVDFRQYNKNNFPYKIYQRSDSENALGQVKFMFENSYSIYLHDTPSKNLFFRDYRALSHGCIRVQNAMQMSEIILTSQKNKGNTTAIYLKKGYPVKVYLDNLIPISIVYFTCFSNLETRELQFFSDIYAKDYKILLALEKY